MNDEILTERIYESYVKEHNQADQEILRSPEMKKAIVNSYGFACYKISKQSSELWEGILRTVTIPKVYREEKKDSKPWKKKGKKPWD